jgi:hypothetical protein
MNVAWKIAVLLFGSTAACFLAGGLLNFIYQPSLFGPTSNSFSDYLSTPTEGLVFYKIGTILFILGFVLSITILLMAALKKLSRTA